MIHPKARFSAGKGCSVDPLAVVGFEETGKGTISMGDSVRVRPYAILRSCGGAISIGNRCVIGSFTVMHAHGGIALGMGVLVSPHVGIYAQNHGIHGCGWIGSQPQSKDPVVIEDGAWIGANAVIVGPCRIGKGAVIGAGSVVAGWDVPDNAVVIGNPARVIGTR